MTQPDHPDADIYPRATGAAAAWFDKHKSEQPLKLYSGWFCPFVQRALLVLYTKNIPFQYIEVNPYRKPESLLRLNPRGLVPTVEVPRPDGGAPKPLIESAVICEFLDEVYRDEATYGPPLMPEDAYERARARVWIGFIGSSVVPAWQRWLQFEGEASEAGRREFWENIAKVVEQMDPRGPFWAGETPGLVDFAIAPWVVRGWVFKHFGKGDADVHPGDEKPIWWDRWLQFKLAVDGLPAIKDTLSESKYYLPIYQRYAENRAQSEAAKAIRAGKPIP